MKVQVSRYTSFSSRNVPYIVGSYEKPIYFLSSKSLLRDLRNLSLAIFSRVRLTKVPVIAGIRNAHDPRVVGHFRVLIQLEM